MSLFLRIGALWLCMHVWLFVIPWTVAHQPPLSIGFSRQEYWSRLSFPSPGDHPDPGIKPMSPASRFFQWILYQWAICKTQEWSYYPWLPLALWQAFTKGTLYRFYIAISIFQSGLGKRQVNSGLAIRLMWSLVKSLSRAHGLLNSTFGMASFHPHKVVVYLEPT